ncbi:MAG TPA: hypothetical protein PKH07_09305, partial [bacterium]|nr:hypothetical protein [bacterium]
TGSDPFLYSPAINVNADGRHYLLIRMRSKLKTARIDRYPSSPAKIYFTTQAQPSFSEMRSVGFVAYGTNHWNNYLVFLGDHPYWTGTVTQLRLDPCSLGGVLLEIDKILFLEDVTVPEFVLNSNWNPREGETIRDLSPSLRLFDYHDNASGIKEAKFYYQEITNGTAGQWLQDGVADVTPEDGFSHTFNSLHAGAYNFSASLTDKAGNTTWRRREDQILSHITLDASAETLITVDAFKDLGEVNKKVFGNNMHTDHFSDSVSVTGEWVAAFDQRVREMGLPFHRFHLGYSSDRFTWKDCVWINGFRPDLIPDPCSGDTTTNLGPVRFGMEEFFARCEREGTVPYLTLEYRCSLDTQEAFERAVQDAADLVEYCLAPAGVNINGGTDWAQIRADNGHPAPYQIEYIELGNEAWGYDACGNVARYVTEPAGSDPAIVAERNRNMARRYMLDYFLYQEAMKAVDPSVKLVACGLISIQEGMGVGERDEIAWDSELYSVGGDDLDAVQGHPYYPYSAWQSDTTKLYWETLATAAQYDSVIQNRRAMVRRHAPGSYGRLQTVFSEYNVNYSFGFGDPARINLDCSRKLMACVTLADVLGVCLNNSDMILGCHHWHLYKSTYYAAINKSGSSYWRNGQFFILKMFNQYFGSRMLDARVTGVETYDYTKPKGCILPPQHGVPMLSAYASRNTEGDLVYLVVVNKHMTDPVTAIVSLQNYVASGVDLQTTIREFNGPTPLSYNTASSEVLNITESSGTFNGIFEYTFPAHSVTNFAFSTTGETIPTPYPTNTTGVAVPWSEAYR